MKTYIGGNCQHQARACAEALEAAGATITAGWISDPEFKQRKSPTTRARKAVQCINEIREADACVFFDPPGTIPGGLHVEVGYSLGAGKPTFVIFQEGRRSNTIMYHPRIRTCYSVANVVEQLGDAE